MKKKLVLDHFIAAAELIDDYKQCFCCNALSMAGDPKGLGYNPGKPGWIKTPERNFFEQVFEVGVAYYGATTFNSMHNRAFPSEEYMEDLDLKEFRVLALCLAYELAKDENEKSS